MNPFATLLALFALASSVSAQQTLTSAGETYAQICNANGYVLSPQSGGSPIYLGKSCDSFQQGTGEGKWCQANGGIIVRIGQTEIPFGRQELFCPGGEDASFPTPCFCANVFEAFQ